MSKLWGAAGVVLLTLGAGAAMAQAPLPVETMTVETRIKPGPNVFVVAPNWAGSSTVSIYSADDLAYKGNFAAGLNAQFTLSGAGDVGYVASAYPKRITSGPAEVVLQRFDVATLKTTQELALLPKFALLQAARGVVAVSPDGARAYVQNATPATSVSVVDLKTGALTAEVPIPGCWGINLAVDGSKFTSLCGDGRLLTVTLGANGKPSGQAYSAKVFDVDKDPLFTHAQRVGGDLVFVSYSGVLHRVSDAGEAARLVDTFAFTRGVRGDWAPGGYAVMAYNPTHDVMFVAMHSGAKDGSHKNGSQEIWAIDVGRKAVLYRSVAKGLTQLAVTQGAQPVVFGVNSHEGGVYRFEIDPAARFAAKLTKDITLRDAAFVVAP
jgi:methylamine dehydrogenase heavy chain